MTTAHRIDRDSRFTRRQAVQAGAIGLLGLSLADVAHWRAAAAEAGQAPAKPKAVIYVFLTGGPSQHDTFDMKPDGPVEYRGEFRPIATKTPGVQICEHLPRLAERSDRWALVRSLTHTENDHERGTYVMLTGRSVVPPTVKRSLPQSTDDPSIAAVAGYATQRRGHLPPSAILPEKIYHSNSGVYPGQLAGMLGARATIHVCSNALTSRTHITRTRERFPSTCSTCTRDSRRTRTIGSSRCRTWRCATTIVANVFASDWRC